MFKFIPGINSKKKQDKPKPELELVNTRVRCEHGYLLIYGLVINVSDHDMNSVVAIAECFSSNGEFVKKADMLVHDMTIKPKQISSFSISTVSEPDIKNVKISFKYFLGKRIAASDIYWTLQS